MDTERKAFSFYRSYYEASKDLPTKEAQADFLMAICTYIFDGEEPELHGVASAMFKLAKPNLETSIKRANAGQIGGNNNKKQNKTEANDKQIESKVEANEKQNESNEEANPKRYMINDYMINEKDKKEKVKKEKNSDAENGFDVFWEHYPRHDSKQKARESYIKALKKGVTLDVLLGAIEKQKQTRQWQENGGQYIPYPATWLNQQRWEDEVLTEMPQQRKFQAPIRKNDAQAGYARAAQILGITEGET